MPKQWPRKRSKRLPWRNKTTVTQAAMAVEMVERGAQLDTISFREEKKNGSTMNTFRRQKVPCKTEVNKWCRKQSLWRAQGENVPTLPSHTESPEITALSPRRSQSSARLLVHNRRPLCEIAIHHHHPRFSASLTAETTDIKEGASSVHHSDAASLLYALRSRSVWDDGSPPSRQEDMPTATPPVTVD